MNPNQSETKFLIQINQNQSEWNLVSDWFGFIRIDVSELIELSWIDFWPFFIKRDRFRIIRIGSDTDIGINRKISDWLGMNFNPIPPKSEKKLTFAKIVMKKWKMYFLALKLTLFYLNKIVKKNFFSFKWFTQ